MSSSNFPVLKLFWKMPRTGGHVPTAIVAPPRRRAPCRGPGRRAAAARHRGFSPRGARRAHRDVAFGDRDGARRARFRVVAEGGGGRRRPLAMRPSSSARVRPSGAGRRSWRISSHPAREALWRPAKPHPAAWTDGPELGGQTRHDRKYQVHCDRVRVQEPPVHKSPTTRERNAGRDGLWTLLKARQS